MEQKLTPDSTSYEAKLSLLIMNTVYRIILHRIANHYSPEELSFLVGQKQTLISEIERLEHTDLDFGDFYRIGYCLGSEGVDGLSRLYHQHDPSEKTEFSYRLTKTTNAEGILYQMERLIEGRGTETLFILKDENPAIDYYEHSTEQEIQLLKTAVQALIDLKYFHKERTPYELFSKCKMLLWNHIKPRNLYIVMSKFTKQKFYPKLRYKSSKQLGYHYILAQKG